MILSLQPSFFPVVFALNRDSPLYFRPEWYAAKRGLCIRAISFFGFPSRSSRESYSPRKEKFCSCAALTTLLLHPRLTVHTSSRIKVMVMDIVRLWVYIPLSAEVPMSSISNHVTCVTGGNGVNSILWDFCTLVVAIYKRNPSSAP